MSITSKANTESEFQWIKDQKSGKDLLRVKNAVLMYLNFSGAPGKFDKGGKRSFVLVLSNEIAEELKELGWNVKERAPRTVDEEWLYTTEIIVNMKSPYPPKIFLCSEKNGKKRMVRLDEDMLNILDQGEFSRFDILINPWKHDKTEKYIYKGYCTELYAHQAVSSNFGDEYADFELVNDPAAVSHPTEDDDGDLPF